METEMDNWESEYESYLDYVEFETDENDAYQD